MNDWEGVSGPQFRANRPPVEQEAVRTTIVGGRPPGSGKPVGDIPRGIEVLVKKASVDPAFKELLLTERAGAARHIGLELTPAETLMLAAVPRTQLETIIARTSVPQEHRRAFLGHAATAMIAALGAATAGCGETASKGVRPDRPASKGIRPDRPVDKGIRPDSPVRGIRPDQPPEETGSRPDRPFDKGEAHEPGDSTGR